MGLYGRPGVGILPFNDHPTSPDDRQWATIKDCVGDCDSYSSVAPPSPQPGRGQASPLLWTVLASRVVGIVGARLVLALLRSPSQLALHSHGDWPTEPLMVPSCRPDPPCHPEPIRFTQGKLREGSRSMGVEMLRCAQHDRVPQHDKIPLSPRPLLKSRLEHASRRITKTCFSLMLYTVTD